jgi:hypothetical protein
LASRTLPYRGAVSNAGPLARTPVVEILPLAMAEVVSYLTGGTEQPALRWDTVARHLHGDGNGPLTDALPTALMAWLTRIVYAVFFQGLDV